MNKKLRNSIMSLFLVAAILISGAFAYLTDTEEKTNTFTMGEVDITLTEPSWDPTNGEDLWAGKKLPKDPTVTNDGINDAYVYMMVEVPKASSLKIVGDDNTASLKENYPLFEYAVNSGWTLLDSETGIEDEAYDYYLYAYDTKLAKDESATLFNSVTFANITSDFARALAEQDNRELDVTVTAYAIQSDLTNATDAATAWNLYANQNEWGWPTRPYEGTLADLESKHEFEYYSKFSLAVNDVNNSEIGVNADVDRPDAVAGIYTEEGEAPTIVLFTNAEETGTVNIAADMNINLAGNTLNLKESYGLNTKNNGYNVYIDGRIDGSAISSTSTGSQGARCVQVLYNDSVTIENVTLITQSESGPSNCALVGGKLYVKDCVMTSKSNSGTVSPISDVGNATAGSIEVLDSEIIGFSSSGMTQGIIANGSTVLSVDNSTINASSNSNSVNGVQIGHSEKYPNATPAATIKNSNIYTNSGGQSYGILVDGAKAKLNANNCTVIADSPYKDVSDKSYRCAGIDVSNNATAIIKDCNVKGVHSGIQNLGILYVDGGTYQGWGHGGIYFANANNNAYVKNANLGQWDYDGQYDTASMGGGNNGAAMYIGCGSGINVYMDNCALTALCQVITIRQGSGEQNNTLRISNSTINTHDIRIDNATHKLYIGKGCNFDVNSVASNKSVVTQTNEVYTFDMPN